MPSADIIVENDIQESFRVAAMRGLFDVAVVKISLPFSVSSVVFLSVLCGE